MGAQLRPCGCICWSDSGKSSQASRSAQAPAGEPCPTAGNRHLFPDFGGKAPICPAPRPKPTCGPITLDVLQGEWQSGSGSNIIVSGTAVYLNGLPLRGHAVELHGDGAVRGVGRLWQLDGWAEDGAAGSLQFRASSAPGGTEFAPKEVWARRGAAGAGWAERMRLLGYAGTAADPLNRGVEGCIPGTLAQDMPPAQDAQDLHLLQALLERWREPALYPVRPRQVVPDVTNRENTGVGVELVHYLAARFREEGFRKRRGSVGHDIPVVVREPPGSPGHQEALSAWREKVGGEEGFPPVRIGAGEEIFASLGNGHFFQALNLYGRGCPAINGGGRYAAGRDGDLLEAISEGVPSIVLSPATPRPVRAKIAQLLNAKREFLWTLNDDGTVDTDAKENTAYCNQFECMSKFLDAVVVDSLVRTHLGVRESKRIQG